MKGNRAFYCLYAVPAKLNPDEPDAIWKATTSPCCAASRLSDRVGGTAQQLLPLPIAPEFELALLETMFPLRFKLAVPVALFKMEYVPVTETEQVAVEPPYGVAASVIDPAVMFPLPSNVIEPRKVIEDTSAASSPADIEMV